MIKEILENKEELNEVAMKGKWTSRKGYGDPAGFAYKDDKVVGIIAYRFGEFHASLWSANPDEADNEIVQAEDKETYTQIKDAFKDAGYTIPKELKVKLEKAVLKALGF